VECDIPEFEFWGEEKEIDGGDEERSGAQEFEEDLSAVAEVYGGRGPLGVGGNVFDGLEKGFYSGFLSDIGVNSNTRRNCCETVKKGN
jgi:hypothetical protein